MFLLTYMKSENCSVMSDSLRPHELYSPWNSPGKNNGVGSLSLLHGIFPAQGFLRCRWILYQLIHKGSLGILEWVAYPFSSRSSWPRIKLGSSALQADSLPTELSGKPYQGWEDPLEEGTAIRSSILAWRIPWTVQFMGSQRVGHDLAAGQQHSFLHCAKIFKFN